MLDEKLLRKLSEITEEEKAILDGNDSIDRTLYMSSESNIINSKKLLEAGKLITLRTHTRFIAFPEHSHDYVEIIYMCSGSTTHIINNRELILHQGELLFLNPGIVHSIKKANADDIAVNFIILPQFFHQSLIMLGEEESPLKRFILECLTGKSHDSSYLYFKVSDVLPIQNLLENLLFTLTANTPNERRLNEITMGLLLLNILGHTDRLFVEHEENALMLKVFRYVEENYRSGTLSELADMLHFDLYWLSREIKNKTKKNFKEHLQEKRLSQAAYLLRTTGFNISDIANSVGYENISYFHRLFASRFCMSPKKYRDCK